MSFRHVGLPQHRLMIGLGYGVVTERAFNASFDRAIADGAYLAGADRLLLIANGARFDGLDLASLTRVIERIREQEVKVGQPRLRTTVFSPDAAVDWFPQLFAAVWRRLEIGGGECLIATSLDGALACLDRLDAREAVDSAIVGALLRA